MRRFELSKWYLDVVAPDGRCAIVYVARLRLGPLTLHVQGLLRAGPRGVETRWSVLPARAPRRVGRGLRLACPGLGVRAALDPLDPPFERRLHGAGGGALDWRCLLPRAEVELTAGGETLRGLGYAEQLHLTLPPSALPIQTLRWGRLLSPAGGLVWIGWDGPAPLRLTLRDGRPAAAGAISDRAVQAAGAHHLLRRERTLRDAPLSCTARGLAAPVRALLPRATLALREEKWLSSGAVAGAPGFAIHEVVEWP